MKSNSRTYLYGDFVAQHSRAFDAELDAIVQEHNYELGTEFEVALSLALSKLLPRKYGVCRGYVVDRDGNKAGDDIIIYDHSRFPAIRQFDLNDFSRKQQIPIEAAYCYLEAKHSVDFSPDPKNSLDRAVEQVRAVKDLVSKRDAVPLVMFDDPYFSTPLVAQSDVHEIRNPFYGAIISRQARCNGDLLEKSSLIQQLFRLALPRLDPQGAPDLIVAGRNNVVVPTLQRAGHQDFNPFFWPGKTGFAPEIAEEIALGVGFCCLAFALDWIRLGKMPWPHILADAFGLPLV